MRKLREREIHQQRIMRREKERIVRLGYRGEIERMIRDDQITVKTRWQDLILKIKDKIWYQDLLTDKINNPRETFFDYKLSLVSQQKKFKKIFKNILKKNVEKFHKNLQFENFEKLEEIQDLVEEIKKQEFSNSVGFVLKYIFDKL